MAYIICRISFIFENWTLYSEDSLDYVTLFRGGLLFDTSAICYTNILFILLFLAAGYLVKIPRGYNLGLKILYTFVNSLFVLLNLVDSVIFTIRQQRSTALVFKEFGGEVNAGSIAFEELLPHWYLVVIEILFVILFWKFYIRPLSGGFKNYKQIVYYTVGVGITCLLTICGMRGAFLFIKANHSISINRAFSYTDEAKATGIVLNTPFTIINTIQQKPMSTPVYFATDKELSAVYTPLHIPADSVVPNKKNVVVIILESFSVEFVGGLNKNLDNGTYKGYTPFLDELLDSCLYFDKMIANTFFSVDAPPALLASIPRAYNPYLISPYANNHINSIATELRSWGYNTAFFMGSDNNSLGIRDFVMRAGFNEYYGKNEYLLDSRFGGLADFDGKWGIWDEQFLHYFCVKLNELPQPFLTSVFTISSHHPFKVPDKYVDKFPKGSSPVHQVIGYTDYALRCFFDDARKQSWFGNTIFVISADHTSSTRSHKEYKNEIGDIMIPILIYDPSGEMPRGRQPGVIQQIDIMPTILNYLGYDKPYIAFGQDMLSTDPDQTWAFNWNNLQMLVMGNYILVMNDGEPIRLYNPDLDIAHHFNLLGKGLPQEKEMETLLKAIIQSYIGRMNRNDLIAVNRYDSLGK